MPAPAVRDIVGNLFGRRLSGSDVVSPYWSEVGSIGEDDARKTLIRWMVRNIHSLVAANLKVQPLKSRSTFNPEVWRQNRVCKAKAKLVQQLAADHVVVRDQEAPVVLGVHVVWQQRIYNIDCKVLSVEPGIHLLLGINDLIDPAIEPVGIRRNWNQRLVVNPAEAGGQVRQRI